MFANWSPLRNVGISGIKVWNWIIFKWLTILFICIVYVLSFRINHVSFSLCFISLEISYDFTVLLKKKKKTYMIFKYIKCIPFRIITSTLIWIKENPCFYVCCVFFSKLLRIFRYFIIMFTMCIFPERLRFAFFLFCRVGGQNTFLTTYTLTFNE